MLKDLERFGDDRHRGTAVAGRVGADESADGTDALTEGSLCHRQTGPIGPKISPEGYTPTISPVRRSRPTLLAQPDSSDLQPTHLQTPSFNVAGLVSS